MVRQKIINYWVYPGLSNTPNQISIVKLINCIELVMGISEEGLKSKERLRDYIDARHIFMIFLRRHTKLSTTRIGEMLNRDHSTVVYGQKKAFNLLDVDQEFRERYKQVEYMTLNPYIFNPDGTENTNTVGYTNRTRVSKPLTIKSIINK